MVSQDDVLNAAVVGHAAADSYTPKSGSEAQTGDQQFADWFKNQFPADEAPAGGDENWWPGWSNVSASFDKLQADRPKAFLPLLRDELTWERRWSESRACLCWGPRKC